MGARVHVISSCNLLTATCIDHHPAGGEIWGYAVEVVPAGGTRNSLAVAPDGVTALIESLDQATYLLRGFVAYQDHLMADPPGFDPFSRDAVDDMARVGKQWGSAHAIALREFLAAADSARSSLATYLHTEAANVGRFPGDR